MRTRSMGTCSMGTWIALISMAGLYVAVLIGAATMMIARARAADCDSGSTEERVACLSQKVADLTAKVEELSKETLKWNDRIALRNEDMRIFPRCLENPGPNTKGLTDVFANSCAKNSGSDLDDLQALSVGPATYRAGRNSGRSGAFLLRPGELGIDSPPTQGGSPMVRTYVTSALAGAIMLGATAALAATGQFDNMCSWGLANHKDVQTDCSINASIKGKTYCFSSAEAKTNFMKSPDANLAKAEAFYKSEHKG